MINLLSATIFMMMILLILVSRKCRELSRRVMTPYINAIALAMLNDQNMELKAAVARLTANNKRLEEQLDETHDGKAADLCECGHDEADHFDEPEPCCNKCGCAGFKARKEGEW